MVVTVKNVDGMMGTVNSLINIGAYQNVLGYESVTDYAIQIAMQQNVIGIRVIVIQVLNVHLDVYGTK